MNNFSEELDQLLDKESEPNAICDLKRYFSDEPEASPFTGRCFNSLGENPADRITGDDLCAVTLLGIQFDYRLVFSILCDKEFQSLASALLRKTPNVNIWEEAADFTAANELWVQLRKLIGIGPTIAGKILSRKRPGLIPIYDSVVSRALKAPSGQYWDSFQNALREQGFIRVVRLRELRDKAGLGEDVTLLRVLDVIVWMHWRKKTEK